MEIIKKCYEKYKEIILYLIFGVLTTVVNFITYYALVFLFKTSYGIAGTIFNIIANIAAILFAYVTNRKFVFEEIAQGKKQVFKEMISFFSCRIFAMLVDSLIYIIGCNILKLPDFIVKSFSQIVIIILNYVSSKLIVFRRKE